jgi:hypothetical protein
MFKVDVFRRERKQWKHSNGGFRTREACDTIRCGRSPYVVVGVAILFKADGRLILRVVDSFSHDYGTPNLPHKEGKVKRTRRHYKGF